MEFDFDPDIEDMREQQRQALLATAEAEATSEGPVATALYHLCGVAAAAIAALLRLQDRVRHLEIAASQRPKE